MITYMIVSAWGAGVGGVTQEAVYKHLDTVPEIVNWKSTLGAIFVVTSMDLIFVWRTVHEKFPTLFFAVVPVNGNQIQGWAEAKTWEFIQKPGPVRNQ